MILLTSHTLDHGANEIQVSIAACCYHNSSKSSLPTSSCRTAYHLELRSCSLSVSNSTYGTNISFLLMCWLSYIVWHCLECNVGIVLPKTNRSCMPWDVKKIRVIRSDDMDFLNFSDDLCTDFHWLVILSDTLLRTILVFP